MYCPECRTEYREGFTECADCHVTLVDVLPDEETEHEEDGRFVNLLETDSPTDIALVRSLLDSGDIEYYVEGEIMKTVQPYAQPAILYVAEEDVERAREILKDCKLNYVAPLVRLGKKNKHHA